MEAIRVYDRAVARLSRRELLNVAWAIGAAAIARPARAAQGVLAKPVFRAYPFTLGVASGDPVATGVVLWTRLAAEPLAGGGMPMAPVDVAWEVAGDPAFRGIVRSGSAIARPELGHSVHVEVDGLQPGRDYWYRFHAGGESSQAGRTRTAAVQQDPDLMAAHASAPFIVTWDDHEVSNNYAGDAAADGTPPEVFALRRAAAYQAYYEAMPLRLSALPSAGRMRLNRRLQFGRLIDLHVLDTRQFRSDQACGDGLKPRCPEALNPRRTMLGTEQERWLFGNLANARGRWTVLGQQVYSFARDMQRLDPAARFAMDRWDGYVGARNRLYARLKETRARNPVVLSGDIHQHFGADLKLDFEKPDSQVIGTELTNTSLSSDGDGEDVASTWAQVRADNPHVKYHSARRGYIACTATPAQMRADFMILDRVTVPGQPVRVGGSLVMEDGKPGATAV